MDPDVPVRAFGTGAAIHLERGAGAKGALPSIIGDSGGSLRDEPFRADEGSLSCYSPTYRDNWKTHPAEWASL